ncbi:MAG: hypothetical protein GX969_04990 [Firmicutes bacterium]|nr:hypothetical protein [Bacillota bacterium]
MSQQADSYSFRAGNVACFLVIIFVILISDLIWLQLVRGETLAKQARNQRMEVIATIPLRGTIYDRNMQILAGTFYKPAVIIFPRFIENKDKIIAFLSSVFDGNIATDSNLSQLLAQTYIYIDANKIASLEPGLEIPDDPGVVIFRQPIRYDPQGLASHIVGYLNEQGTSGVSGIEKAFDPWLHSGKSGMIVSFVDAKRVPCKELGVRFLFDSEPLNDVILTIDHRVQEIVEKIMDARIRKGAVVVMEPDTGQVLALASRPNFSPNNMGNALTEPMAPMINRAITPYRAGPIFKIAVAACGLETGIVSLPDRFYDPGFIDVGTERFKCRSYEIEGHGSISFLDAMAHSCDYVFINIALRIGGKTLLSFCRDLGFGTITGIGLPFEQPGMLPDAYHISQQDIMGLALGRGDVLVTPLQVGILLSAIANGGKLIHPELILNIDYKNMEPSGAFKFFPSRRVLSPDTCRQLTFMLESVTRWGTGKSGWVCEIGSCGKTGTVETEKPDTNGTSVSHVWFGGFTPLENPRFVIVILVEDGDSGDEIAAPIFKEIAEKLLFEVPDIGVETMSPVFYMK